MVRLSGTILTVNFVCLGLDAVGAGQGLSPGDCSIITKENPVRLVTCVTQL